MNSIQIFLIFIPILSFILLGTNFILAPHKPYKEKKTPFECGYHSFLAQNRTQFTISFFVFGLLFLLFDLEIVLIYPYTTSSLFNDILGLVSVILFLLVLTLGFVFELNKKALKIDTLQDKRNITSTLFFSNTISYFKRSLKNKISSHYIWSFLIVTKFKVIFVVLLCLLISVLPVIVYTYIDFFIKLFISLCSVSLFITIYLSFLEKSVNKNTFIVPMFISLCFTTVVYIVFKLYGDCINHAFMTALLSLSSWISCATCFCMNNDMNFTGEASTSNVNAVNTPFNSSNSPTTENPVTNTQSQGTPYDPNMKKEDYIPGPVNNFIPFEAQNNKVMIGLNSLARHTRDIDDITLVPVKSPYRVARNALPDVHLIFGYDILKDKETIKALCAKLAHGPTAFFEIKERAWIRQAMAIAWPNDFNLSSLKDNRGWTHLICIPALMEELRKLDLNDPALIERARNFRSHRTSGIYGYAPRIDDNVYILHKYPAVWENMENRDDVLKNLNFVRSNSNSSLNNVNTIPSAGNTPIANDSSVNTSSPNRVSPILSAANPQFSNNSTNSPIINQASAVFPNSNTSNVNINEQVSTSDNASSITNRKRKSMSPDQINAMDNNRPSKTTYKPDFFDEQDSDSGFGFGFDAAMFHPSRHPSPSSRPQSPNRFRNEPTTIDPSLLSFDNNFTSNRTVNRTNTGNDTSGSNNQ